MTLLTLYSLDVLMYVPRLYARALQRTFDNKVSREDALELLADARLSVYNVIQALCIDRLLSYEEAVRRFNRCVPDGAHGCVKEISEIYGVEGVKGVFYPLAEDALMNVVLNASLPVDVVSGICSLEGVGDLVRKAFDRARADKLTLVVGSSILVPTNIEDDVNAQVDCLRKSQIRESSEKDAKS